MNIGTLLPRHARYRPDHPAVVFEDQRLTFRRFNARANRLANALGAAGLAKGDKLATVLPNCLELLDVYWAAAKTGIVVVPMSPLLQEAGLTTLLRNSDAGLTDADPYNIIYSSGTTGEPKGIVHTHYVRAGYCAHFASAWRMTPESVVLHAGALVFNGAFLDLMPWMFLGCTYILHPAFDAGRMLAEVA